MLTFPIEFDRMFANLKKFVENRENKKMIKLNLTDSCPGEMSIGDLWEELYYLAKFIRDYHEFCDGEYPLDKRKAQMSKLKHLVSEIEKFHTMFED